MSRELLKKIKVQTADEVLRNLVRSASASLEGEGRLPFVRVTAGPHIYCGVPVKIEDRFQESWLVLFQSEGGLRGSDTVAYVPMKSVNAVVVEGFSSEVLAIIGNEAPPIKADDVPSRLTVERAAQDFYTQLKGLGWSGSVKNDWAGNETNPEARFRLMRVIEMLKKLPADVMSSIQKYSEVRLVAVDSSEFEVKVEASVVKFMVGMKVELKALETHTDPSIFDVLRAKLKL